jgi:murein L,D-transpeptidase YafK
MGTSGLDIMVVRFARLAFALCAAVAAASCSKVELSAAMQPLSQETMMLLGKKGMSPSAPIFIRIFKEESELEVWKQREDGRFYLFRTYPICNWSGSLGPKVTQGDMQSPEGFYTITSQQMNPNSQYHLAFNLGFPNQFDKSLGRNGQFLMVHGNCRSAGCYAMTDALMEEIYGLAREAFIGGQPSFEVHAFPFRMTEANMRRYGTSPHYRFWRMIKEGFDYFETTRQLPAVAICERRYVVNVRWRGGDLARLNPQGYCPPFERPAMVPFTPLDWSQQAATDTKLGPMFGLGASPSAMSAAAESSR